MLLRGFRILTYLTYGEYQWRQDLGNGRLQVTNGPMARLLRIDIKSYKKQLVELKRLGFIEKLEFGHNRAWITLKRPQTWKRTEQV
jgi:hypothetical protein